MRKANIIKREQRASRLFGKLNAQRKYSLPKGWHKTKVVNLLKMQRGDMVLTVSRRHTLGGLFSRSVAKAINGPYAHVGAYMGKTDGRHLVRDFKGTNGHRRIVWGNFAKTGVDLKVVRWKGATEAQMKDFIHNLERIPGKIGTKYDFLQAAGYPKSWHLLKMDLEKYFTCSEYLSTAGSPNKKEMSPPYNLKRPKPPLLFHPTLSPEMVTPTVINAAIKSGILDVITEQTWKKH